MRIVYITNVESNHSRKWADYFRKDHEVFILKLKKSKFKILEILTNILSVRKQIKKLKPDIVHAHYASVNGVLGAFSDFHPYIITAWGSDILIAPESKFSSFLIKFGLKKADIITCDGNNSVKALKDLGVNPKKIHLIYFGVDVKKFLPVKHKSPKLNVISLRNLEPIYDVETLVRAIPIVLDNFKEVKFIIAGEGSQKNYLKNLVKELNISDQVEFIGAIKNDELPVWLNKADIYVSTSLSDGGISMSTSEAMACSLPVVITDFGDNKRWVENGENGFLFPLQDYKKLAEKLIILCKDKEMREKFGIISRKLVVKNNNYFTEMNKMEDIYKIFKK